MTRAVCAQVRLAGLLQYFDHNRPHVGPQALHRNMRSQVLALARLSDLSNKSGLLLVVLWLFL
jgi:hypothetical protein